MNVVALGVLDLHQGILVLAHGTMVAIVNGNKLWPMFFFGFGGIFIITQMYGLNLKNWAKWAFLALYIGGAAFVYSGRGVGHWWELGAIPLIDYPAVVVLALLIGLIVRVTGWRRPTARVATN